MNPVVIDTMNDILNKVETREWRRVTEQRDRILRHKKRLAKQVDYWKTATGEAEDRLDDQMKENEEMHGALQTDWAVATEKIGQENSDLHNEIKRLKDRLRNFENVAKEYEQRNNDLQRKNYDLEVAVEEKDDEIASLFEDVKEKRLPKGWHMVEAEASLKVSRDLMKVSEERCNLRKENEKLKQQRDEYLENWKSTTRKYVAVTTREQRLKALTDK